MTSKTISALGSTSPARDPQDYKITPRNQRQSSRLVSTGRVASPVPMSTANTPAPSRQAGTSHQGSISIKQEILPNQKDALKSLHKQLGGDGANLSPLTEYFEKNRHVVLLDALESLRVIFQPVINGDSEKLSRFNVDAEICLTYPDSGSQFRAYIYMNAVAKSVHNGKFEWKDFEPKLLELDLPQALEVFYSYAKWLGIATKQNKGKGRVQI